MAKASRKEQFWSRTPPCTSGRNNTTAHRVTRSSDIFQYIRTTCATMRERRSISAPPANILPLGSRTDGTTRRHTPATRPMSAGAGSRTSRDSRTKMWAWSRIRLLLLHQVRLQLHPVCLQIHQVCLQLHPVCLQLHPVPLQLHQGGGASGNYLQSDRLHR